MEIPPVKRLGPTAVLLMLLLLASCGKAETGAVPQGGGGMGPSEISKVGAIAKNFRWQ